MQHFPELRQELATAASNEEIYAVLDAIRSERDSSPTPLPQPMPPEDVLMLTPGNAPAPENSVLWRRVRCLACKPCVRSRRAVGMPCAWVVLLGVGRTVLTPAAFTALRDATRARDWLCRPHAVYLCLETSDALLEALLADGHACLYTVARDGQ